MEEKSGSEVNRKQVVTGATIKPFVCKGFTNLPIEPLISTIDIFRLQLQYRVSASQTLLTNEFYESVELGKAAANTETIY
jgi:hypothetical protein